MTADPTILLSEQQVAAHLGCSVDTVRRCRNATISYGAVHPMPGWRRLGTKYVIPAPALAAWIDKLPAA